MTNEKLVIKPKKAKRGGRVQSFLDQDQRRNRRADR